VPFGAPNCGPSVFALIRCKAAEDANMDNNFTWAQKALTALLARCVKAIAAEAELMVRRAP
jgi:hypothetical protein